MKTTTIKNVLNVVDSLRTTSLYFEVKMGLLLIALNRETQGGVRGEKNFQIY